MFFACLMYGYMPGMASASMPAPGAAKHFVEKSGDSSEAHGGGHVAGMASDDASGKSDPCPHKESMTHAPFCAACLVLLPELVFAEKGQAPHAAPLPDLQRVFVGNLPAPPLPPPRA